jgi:hypothetical protein
MHQIKQENWFFEKNKGEFHRQNCWWNPFDSNNVTKKIWVRRIEKMQSQQNAASFDRRLYQIISMLLSQLHKLNYQSSTCSISVSSPPENTTGVLVKLLGSLNSGPSPSNLPMYAIPREQPRARATGTATALPTCIYLHPKCTTQ